MITGPTTLHVFGRTDRPVRLQVIAAPVRQSPEIVVSEPNAVRFRGPPEIDANRASIELRDIGSPESSVPLGIVARVPRHSTVNAFLDDCTANLSGDFNKVQIRNRDGNIRLDLGTYQRARLESRSGDIRVGDVVREADLVADTQSGAVNVRNMFRNAQLHTVNGKVNVLAEPADDRRRSGLSIRVGPEGTVDYKATSPEAREKIRITGKGTVVEHPTGPTSGRPNRQDTHDSSWVTAARAYKRSAEGRPR